MRMSGRTEPRRGRYLPKRPACILPAIAVFLSLVSGCARSNDRNIRNVDVGHHRVRFTLPEGWEHLDHGRQQLIRLGEAQISLLDLGPVSREAMVAELRAGEALWLAGRRKDAFERVRELRSPALRYGPRQQLSEFWR